MDNENSIPKTSSKQANKTPKESNTRSLTPLQQFKVSMKIGFEEWHDGIGYDIKTLRIASQAERNAIEQILINHSPCDWRDIEALAEINTKCAREIIKEAIKDPNPVFGLQLQDLPQTWSLTMSEVNLLQMLCKPQKYSAVSHKCFSK